MEKWYVIQTRVREEEKLVSLRENDTAGVRIVSEMFCAEE